MVSLEGKSRFTIETTKAELSFLILSRADFEGVSSEQITAFNEFVENAVSLICHAAPEYVIPAKVCQDAKALSASVVGSLKVNGKVILQESDDFEGGGRHGNA